MLIFLQIDHLVCAVKDRVTLLGSDEDVALDEQRLQVLMQLVQYVNGLTWVSHARLAAKIRCFLRSRYSYSQVAIEFGVSIKAAQKSIMYAAKCLRQRIGSVLELIQDGEIEAAIRELSVVTGEVDAQSRFVQGVTDRFNPKRDDGVVLGEDCRQELAFLSAYSRRKFESIIASLDDRKVNHLLYILFSSDPIYRREKGHIWRCVIDGRSKVDECIRALNDEFIFSPLNYVIDSEP